MTERGMREKLFSINAVLRLPGREKTKAMDQANKPNLPNCTARTVGKIWP